ncbi:type III secretion system cytoplasmic ring protein SctQ [Paraburkholderia bryophila]|uniref:type III secretion system cytoplasmic ring protein SctQ n=1 Tax=Burkholderiaceae TaxID=119060 RepID=UPI0006906153|nr:type III secretion system cytoplasmic ring protein SctQ [Burkholderia sp. 9120]
MIYPLDEPTTEDEAISDPHAAGERARTTESAGLSGAAVRGEARLTASATPVVAATATAAVSANAADSNSASGETHDAPIAPLTMPAITRAAARVTRTVCDTRLAGHLRTTLGITEWQASPTDTRSFDASYVDAGVVDLTLASPDGGAPVSLHLALDLHAYPALSIAAWPDSDALSAKPPADAALRQAVAGVVLEPLLVRLNSAGFKDARVADVRRGRLDTTRPLREHMAGTHAAQPVAAPVIALSFVLAGRHYQAALRAPTACYDLLDRLLHSNAAAQASSTASVSAVTANTDPRTAFASDDQPPYPAVDLDVPGSLILGVKRLPVDTLHALEPGDVLLRATFPSLDAAQSGTSHNLSAPRARLRAVAAWGTPGLTRVCAAVEIDGQSLVIVKEPNMSEELDPASADAGLAIDDPADPIRIGELELPVQFEIDTVALPLAQLSALGPGYVLELPVPAADAQLRLVAHGQTIGYGELVTVGEHLGIRIIRMAHRHGPIQ